MEIVKNVKEVGSEIKESVEKGLEKVEETFDNVVSHLPLANLAKKDSGDFHIEIDMPGIKKEDIEISVADNILTVSAVRKMQNEVKKEDYYLCESSFGRVERKFTIPEGIDQEKISAELEDGVLVIELQKEEKLKPKSIEIK